MFKVVLFIASMFFFSNLVKAESEHEQRTWDITVQIPEQHHTLKNGLRVLFIPNPNIANLSYYTFVRVGSRDEEEGLTGLAHFFEHMMFRGTRKNPDDTYQRVLSEVGARLNAYTSRDLTVYHATGTAGNLDRIIDLEADRFQNLVLNEEKFEIERQVVHEERRQRMERDPVAGAFELFFETLLDKTSYAHPIIGYPEDLDRIQVDVAEQFYREHYRPENALVVVAGNFEPERALARIRRAYGSIPRKYSKLNNDEDSEPFASKFQGPKVLERKVGVRSPILFLGYAAPEAGTREAYVFDVIVELLTRGETSRLYERLVFSEQVATQVFGVNMTLQKIGAMLLGSVLTTVQERDAVRRSILAEVSRLKEYPVSQRDLDRVVKRASIRWLHQLRTSSRQASVLGESLILRGSTDEVLQTPKVWATVTPGEIQKVAKRYLRLEQSLTISLE